MNGEVPIVVLFEGREYSLEVSKTEAADVLAIQLYSICDVDVDDQLLLTYDGRTVQPHDTLADFAPEVPLLLLFRRGGTTGFDPVQDGDWEYTCSRIVAPATPLVQPAFRRSDGTVLCQGCATTCCSPDVMITPVTNDTATRAVVRDNFVTDIAVIAGAADVMPPAGYTKIPMDLNHGDSGRFAFLCYRKGGKARPIAHIMVLRGESRAAVPPGYTTVPINATTALATRRAQAALFRSLEGCGVRNLSVGPSHGVSMVLCATALAPDWTLAYDLAPFAGTVCGAHEPCLFAPRVPPPMPLVSFTTLTGAQMAAGQRLEATARAQWLAQQHRAFAHSEAELQSTLEHQSQRVLMYERPDMQARALAVVPVATLEARAKANTASPHVRFEDEVLHQLIHWFKHEFFSWMNQPACSTCGHPRTTPVRTEGPTTPEEVAGEASRVEVYECPQCRALTRFPRRYNDPTKLLETRVGRCGEWANCFTLCCRAMGYEARYVLDFTDHVWTEVYSPAYERWLHCDPCEDQLDRPLTYEVGWGKELNYIFAFARDHVADVIRRYTMVFEDEVLDRRTRAREAWVQTTIAALNNRLQASLPSARRETLRQWAQREEKELATLRLPLAGETEGRVSGSKEWKEARQEGGGTKAEAEGIAKVMPPGIPPPSPATQPMEPLWQRLFVQLVQGCAEPACVNPHCLQTAAKQPGFDPTQHAAASLALLGALHSVVATSQGLNQLFCAAPDAFQSLVLAEAPLRYWPLQDDTGCAVEVSGHCKHVAHGCSAVAKPMATKFNAASAGLQLLPHKVFTAVVDVPAAWSVVFLIQWHAYAPTTARAVFLRIPELDVALALTPSLRLELVIGTASTSSATAIPWDTTCHVTLVATDGALRLLLNGQEVGSPQPCAATAAVTLSFETTALTAVALVSHVAVLPRALPVAAATALAQRAVPGPKLVASGVQGDVQCEECSLPAAQTDSGYVLSALRLWSGEYFDGLQCSYASGDDSTDGLRLTVGARASQPPDQTLALLPGEAIVRVTGRRGAWMDSFGVTTNFGRSIAAGGAGGGPFEVPLPPGHAVRAFALRLGDHVHDPVVFSAPAPRGPVFAALEAAAATANKPTVAAGSAAVLRYLNNLAAAPTDPRCHKIKTTNGFFVKNVASLGAPHVVGVFTGARFALEMADGDQFWVFQAAEPHALHHIHAAIFDLQTFRALHEL
ncbi:peptide-N(4)-(N-acetyl-beta-glucosaminyl)asparagine amidase [Achlya hypogyna]|uniref:Peptide-N(4)-(N-acetyl-beta-glucosaminyl)asparagine amidase n=1 Tax=Achlya hypogyna TaxID=1202772 RepID=A0A1V9Z8J5_ACHHY|nr:peptide-N(4)-(N-acetyl-beta-glucosaminyl)asparagine amidase [Achlya hypogyna]